MCKAVEALRVTGKRDVVPGVDCAYTAIIEKNDRVRYGATGSFWITKYVPHTYHLCRAAPSYSVKSIARDPRVRAIVKAGGEKVKGRAIVSAVRENLGIAITARSASLVKRTALGEAEEIYNETFQRLPSYAEEFLRLNPGSWFQVRWSRIGEFLSLDLAASNIVNVAMKAGLRLYAIDACTFKGEHYRGHAIQTVAIIDGHADGKTYRNLPVCVTVCDDEIQESYKYHMEMWKNISNGEVDEFGDGVTLYDHIVNKDSVIFIDGGSAIQASVGLQCHGDGNVLKCALHLLANVKNLKVPGFPDGLFWSIQGSRTEAEFEERLQSCQNDFPRIARFLRGKPPQEWTVWGWIARDAVTYGRKTSNPVEQIHSTQLDMRHWSPLAFVEEYLANAAALTDELRKTARVLEQRLISGETPFTAHVTRCLNTVRATANHRLTEVIPVPNEDGTPAPVWQVLEAHDASASVAGTRAHHVNALERTCTCKGRAVNGYACEHEYAVYNLAAQNDELRVLAMDDFASWAAQPCMHSQTFIDAVRSARVLLPAATNVQVDETRRPPGRLQGATQRSHERVRRRISSLGPGGARTITARSQTHSSARPSANDV